MNQNRQIIKVRLGNMNEPQNINELNQQVKSIIYSVPIQKKQNQTQQQIQKRLSSESFTLELYNINRGNEAFRSLLYCRKGNPQGSIYSKILLIEDLTGTEEGQTKLINTLKKLVPANTLIIRDLSDYEEKDLIKNKYKKWGFVDTGSDFMKWTNIQNQEKPPYINEELKNVEVVFAF